MATNETAELLQGTLDLLILRILAREPLHGWGVSLRIQQISDQVLLVNQGSLYPALHRLEKQGLIEAEWGTSESNRRAKYYKLTTRGRRQLTREIESWRRISGAVNLVLQKA